MSGKVAAFAEYDAKLPNDRWGWSAVTPDEKTVVLQLWADRFDRTQQPPRYSEYGNPGLTQNADRLGNAARIKHLRWARDACEGRFRVVIAAGVDDADGHRKTERAYAAKDIVMRLIRLDEDTGEFEAEIVEGADTLAASAPTEK